MERLTQAKLDTLRFVGRQRCVRPPHIERRFGVDRSTAYRRLRELTDRGLLAEFDGISMDGKVFAATRNGLKLARLDLRPAEPDVFHLRHDEAMTNVIGDLESQFAEVIECITERELIAHRRLFKDGRFDIKVRAPHLGRDIAHLPDTVCEIKNADKFIAIEVELSPKNVDRWTEILWGYSRRVDVDGLVGVLYLADDSARPRRLAELAGETGLGARFQIRPITDPDLLGAMNTIIDAANDSSPSESER